MREPGCLTGRTSEPKRGLPPPAQRAERCVRINAHLPLCRLLHDRLLRLVRFPRFLRETKEGSLKRVGFHRANGAGRGEAVSLLLGLGAYNPGYALKMGLYTAAIYAVTGDDMPTRAEEQQITT